mmetsp:Transcript_150858/g.266799  ORF Transcript_150858/g.266799 Transcript_150858/m.266799 type:complete len:776 (+) Transcript_150858:102-2429(+)
MVVCPADDNFEKLAPPCGFPPCSLQPQDLDFGGLEFEEALRRAAEDTQQRLFLLVDAQQEVASQHVVEEALARDEAEAKRVIALARRQLRRERLRTARKNRQKVAQAQCAYPDELPTAWGDMALEDSDEAIRTVRAEIEAKEEEAKTLNETISTAERAHALAAQELRELRNEVKEWCDTVAALEAAEDEKAARLGGSPELEEQKCQPEPVSQIEREISPRPVHVGTMMAASRAQPATVIVSSLMPPAPSSPPVTLKTLSGSASAPTTVLMPSTLGSYTPAQSPGGSPRIALATSPSPTKTASPVRLTSVRQVSLTGSVAGDRPRLRVPLGVSRSECRLPSAERVVASTEIRPSPRRSTPRRWSPRTWSPRPGTALSLSLGSGKTTGSVETPKVTPRPQATTVQLRRHPKVVRAEPKRRVSSVEAQPRRAFSLEPPFLDRPLDQSSGSIISNEPAAEDSERGRVLSRSPPRATVKATPGAATPAGASISSTAAYTPMASMTPLMSLMPLLGHVSRSSTATPSVPAASVPTSVAPLTSVPAGAASPPLALRGISPVVVQQRVKPAGAAPTLAASLSVPPGRGAAQAVPPVALGQIEALAGSISARTLPTAAPSQTHEAHYRKSGFATPSGSVMGSLAAPSTVQLLTAAPAGYTSPRVPAAFAALAAPAAKVAPAPVAGIPLRPAASALQATKKCEIEHSDFQTSRLENKLRRLLGVNSKEDNKSLSVTDKEGQIVYLFNSKGELQPNAFPQADRFPLIFEKRSQSPESRVTPRIAVT